VNRPGCGLPGLALAIARVAAVGAILLGAAAVTGGVSCLVMMRKSR
jgi:hypothetical protein